MVLSIPCPLSESSAWLPAQRMVPVQFLYDIQIDTRPWSTAHIGDIHVSGGATDDHVLFKEYDLRAHNASSVLETNFDPKKNYLLPVPQYEIDNTMNKEGMFQNPEY